MWNDKRHIAYRIKRGQIQFPFAMAEVYICPRVEILNFKKTVSKGYADESFRLDFLNTSETDG
jgi:hypothetical protein